MNTEETKIPEIPTEENQNEQTEIIKDELNIENKPKKAFKIDFKKHWSIVLSIVLLIMTFTFAGQASSAQQKVEELDLELTKVKTELDKIKNSSETEIVSIREAFNSGKWEETIKLAKEFDTKHKNTEENKEAQDLANKAQAKIDEANAAAAEAERLRQEEEAKGYETGITYDQLARTPDDFTGKKVKFYGKVVQVIEGGDSIQIRLAVNDNYDTVLLGEYSKDTVSSRILEDDYITVYGTSVGTITYESTMGGNITIPGVYIDKIDQ